MSLKLYSSRVCPYAQRAVVTLAEKVGRPDVEHVEINLASIPDWYSKINPRETVPSLQLPDGKVFPESLFIAQYLDEHYEPRNQLLTTNPSLRFKILSFIDKSQAATSAMYQLLLSEEKDMEARFYEMKSALANVVKLFQADGPFVMGNTFTMADVAFAPFVIRFRACLFAYCQVNLLEMFPRLAPFLDACLCRPSFSSTTPPEEYFIGAYKNYVKGKKPLWTYTLYAANGCPFCQRVELALLQAIPSEGESSVACLKRHTLDIHGADPLPEWYNRINDEGTVPSFCTPYGDALVGSYTILEFLAAQFPQSGLQPEREEQRLAARCVVDAADGIFRAGRPIYIAKKPVTEIPDGVKEAVKETERLLKVAQPEGPYLGGKNPSLYDCAVLPFIHRGDQLMGSALLADAPLLSKILQAARSNAKMFEVLESGKKH